MCKTLTKENLTTIKRSVNGKKIWIQNVPCLRCQNNLCEEELIHSPSVEKMRLLLEQIKKNLIKEKQVYDFNDIV